ncbi:competence protein ComK [Edaphobacillus lindanitolerans]|uniref:Competence transcription factor ComK n=1 Tax=Edaphobacillus lindanitolerans TaxID=550447 RepID=A0A1U7PKV6_9BACI|nr:competence protein ComK [Edaphobacillus lindanitolerans]SIT72164.1 Competence transcription factor ComK [Edaphobacillus lindanitolerans]
MHKNFCRIGPRTMAILPTFSKNGHPVSIVLEFGKSPCELEMKPRHVIDRTLRSYASSYVGAVQGAAYILKRNHTPPILINAEKPIIMLPTWSSAKSDCAWFSLDHIAEFFEEEKGFTQVILSGGENIKVPMSIQSFNHQFQKALFFRHQLDRADKLTSRAHEPKVTYHIFKGRGIRKSGKLE